MLGFWIFLSWNIRKFPYARVRDIPFPIHKKVPFPEIWGLFRGFCFLKYKTFSRGRVCFILGLGLESARLHFQKYKKRFLWRKYKKSFPSRKYKNFFNIRARKFHFRKHQEQRGEKYRGVKKYPPPPPPLNLFIQNTFLFCKYYEAISVVSSEEISLKYYFKILYSTVPNKIALNF